MKSLFTGLAASLLIGTAAQAVELTEVWRVEDLNNPESVAYDPETGYLYVSNVNGGGDERNGLGYIARLTIDGDVDTREWATGLDGPKGIALYEGQLVVTDIDQVRFVDQSTGEVTRSVPIEGARFLNDTAITAAGRIYVSDSGGSAIHEITEEGSVPAWAGEALAGVNGILPHGDDVLITTMNAGAILITQEGNPEFETLIRGYENADGIAVLPDGTMLLSQWPGQLRAISPDLDVTTLINSREERGFINDFLVVGDLLIVPQWQPGRVVAYRITMSSDAETAQ